MTPKCLACLADSLTPDWTGELYARLTLPIFPYLNKNLLSLSLSLSGPFAYFLSRYRLSHVDVYVYTLKRNFLRPALKARRSVTKSVGVWQDPTHYAQTDPPGRVGRKLGALIQQHFRSNSAHHYSSFFFFLSLFLAKKEMFRQFIWFLRGRVTCVETSFCYGFLTALFSPSRDDGAVKLWITTELVKLFLLLLLLFLPTFHPDSINLGVGMYT